MVANPANTNALILKEFAPSIPPKNITCLTRLDQNRALSQLSEHLKVPVTDVKNVIIWGNHSVTQYPDANYATVTTTDGERPIQEVMLDKQWYSDFQRPSPFYISRHELFMLLLSSMALPDSELLML